MSECIRMLGRCGKYLFLTEGLLTMQVGVLTSLSIDCAGSHKVYAKKIAISKRSFYRLVVHVFGHELRVAWQVQGTRRI